MSANMISSAQWLWLSTKVVMEASGRITRP